MLHLIAERKIVEALERGELANLPGEEEELYDEKFSEITGA